MSDQQTNMRAASQISNPAEVAGTVPPLHQLPQLQPATTYIKHSLTWYKSTFGKIAQIVIVPIIVSIGSFMIPQETPLIVAYALFSVLVTIAANIAIMRIISAPDPAHATVSNSFSTTLPYILPSILLSILTSLAVMGGFFLIVIPGIYFAIALSFAMYVLIVENKRGFGALTQSMHYIRGYWWAVFGRFVVFFLCVLLVSFAVSFLSSLLASALGVPVSQQEDDLFKNSLSSIITVGFVVPLNLIYVYLLYTSLKAIKPAGPDAVTAAKDRRNAMVCIVLGVLSVLALVAFGAFISEITKMGTMGDTGGASVIMSTLMFI